MYSADRHNRNLHNGQAKIVRMIDYVVGRISGEYQPANPLAYRSTRKHHESTGSISNAVSAGSFPFESVAHDSSEKSSTTTARLSNENHETDRHASINSVQQINPHLGNSDFESKFDSIVKLSREVSPDPTTEVLLKQFALRVAAGEVDEAALDNCLQKLRNQMNVKDAVSFLSNGSYNEARDPPRAPLQNHHVEHLPESSRMVLAQIEQSLKRTENVPIVWEKVQYLIRRCETTTDHTFLNHYLESCRPSSSAYAYHTRERE